jgi:ferredoxin
MKNMVCYFTGRGNSLKTAEDLAERLGSTELVPIRHDTLFRADPDAERIGIVTSVIDCGLPTLVKRFVRRMPRGRGGLYVFSVVTNGGLPGATVRQLETLLKKRTYALSAGWQIKFGLEWSDDEAWAKAVDGMARAILAREVRRCPVTLADVALTGVANTLAGFLIPSEDKKFRVSSACTGCGMCKRVCPAGNIEIVDEKPVFKHKCAQCAACFSWCPREAITGTNLAARTRWRNPSITPEQMVTGN